MRGFSLVELLVVVAIIGILGAVGVIGYNGYIESTKEQVTIDNALTVDRAFTHDVMVIDNEMTDGRTALATDQTISSPALMIALNMWRRLSNR